jgi:hypothetical protein
MPRLVEYANEIRLAASIRDQPLGLRIAFECYKHLMTCSDELLQKEAMERDATGYTALHMCCGSGFPRVAIRRLCDVGVDVNAVSHGGYTPIMSAAITGHYTAVDELALRRVNLALRNNEGYSVFTIIGHPDALTAVPEDCKIACVKVLRMHGISSDGKDRGAGVPRVPQDKYATSMFLFAKSWLISEGGEIPAGYSSPLTKSPLPPDEDDKTSLSTLKNEPILCCIRAMDLSLIALSKEAKERTTGGITTFMRAALNAYPAEVLTRLREAWPQAVNSRDEGGGTAIMCAAW